MSIAHAKRLRELVAVPGWLALLWNLIGVISRLDFISKHLHGVFDFLTSPVGNTALTLFGLAWLFAVVLWPTRSGASAKQSYIGQGDLSVWVVGDKATVRLVIFSAADLTLTFIKATISTIGRDSYNAFSIESGEPLRIPAFTATHKTLERALTPDEERRFEGIKRVDVSGVAHFADGTDLKFSFLTIAFR